MLPRRGCTLIRILLFSALSMYLHKYYLYRRLTILFSACGLYLAHEGLKQRQDTLGMKIILVIALCNNYKNTENSKVFFLWGKMTSKERATLQQRMNRCVEQGISIRLLGTYASASTGYNLVQCNRVYLLDQAWNPQVILLFLQTAQHNMYCNFSYFNITIIKTYQLF
jgi:hypothetical protein